MMMRISKHRIKAGFAHDATTQEKRQYIYNQHRQKQQGLHTIVRENGGNFVLLSGDASVCAEIKFSGGSFDHHGTQMAIVGLDEENKEISNRLEKIQLLFQEINSLTIDHKIEELKEKQDAGLSKLRSENLSLVDESQGLLEQLEHGEISVKEYTERMKENNMKLLLMNESK